MTSQNVFIPFNFENAWNFFKIYHICCNFWLKIVENICIDTVWSYRHHFLFIVNIFRQQFSLQITRTLSIEFVKLLHYLMCKTNRFRFSVRVYCHRSQTTSMCGVVITTLVFQAGRPGFKAWSDLYSRS